MEYSDQEVDAIRAAALGTHMDYQRLTYGLLQEAGYFTDAEAQKVGFANGLAAGLQLYMEHGETQEKEQAFMDEMSDLTARMGVDINKFVLLLFKKLANLPGGADVGTA